MVYPVRSRRSRGISIGINLFPHRKVCDLDCIYCEVDNPGTSGVEPSIPMLQSELNHVFTEIRDGRAFSGDRINDIAFSGDGEPTISPLFGAAVDVAADVRRRLADPALKLVLITDALTLHRAPTRAAIATMMQNNGEIWAKLDAGTEEYYKLVDRGHPPLARQIENIKEVGREHPVVIQSMFLRVHGNPPPHEEISSYISKIKEILAAGARICRLDIYTIARPTTETYATALDDATLDGIAARVRSTAGLSSPVEVYYSNR